MITGLNRGQQRRFKRDNKKWSKRFALHIQFPKTFSPAWVAQMAPNPGGRLGKFLREGIIDVKKTVMRLAS